MKGWFKIFAISAMLVSAQVSLAASKEEIAVCDAKHEFAFSVMNARQNLTTKEGILAMDGMRKPDRVEVINRAYSLPEVPVHRIAYAVRDFAKEERELCMLKLAI